MLAYNKKKYSVLQKQEYTYDHPMLDARLPERDNCPQRPDMSCILHRDEPQVLKKSGHLDCILFSSSD